MDDSLSLTELHWLAGLLEGEGSFMAGPPSSPGLPIIAVAIQPAAGSPMRFPKNSSTNAPTAGNSGISQT